jgi:hypothetical protein
MIVIVPIRFWSFANHVAGESPPSFYHAFHHSQQASVVGSHAWGKIYCQFGHSDCWMMIWSTPRNPENHAKRIRTIVDAWPGPDEEYGS